MKKYILLLSVVCMFSCNDLFDKTNLESMGSDIVWKDPLLVETTYMQNIPAGAVKKMTSRMKPETDTVHIRHGM